jgi:hypothetical protein
MCSQEVHKSQATENHRELVVRRFQYPWIIGELYPSFFFILSSSVCSFSVHL